MWQAVSSPSAWTGNGFGPPRIDRAAVYLRLGDEVPTWIAGPLIDAFEAAALEAIEKAKKKKSIGNKTRDDAGAEDRDKD